MEAVVDPGFSLPALHPALQRGLHISRRMHPAKIYVRGHAAERHPERILLGSEREFASGRLHGNEAREMSVRLDTARDDELATGIDHATRLHTRILNAHRDDLLALDPDAPFANALRSDDITAANQ